MHKTLAAVLTLFACGDGEKNTPPGDGLDLDLSLCAPENGPFTVEIDNEFLPFEVGAVHVLEGLEGGREWGRFEMTVTDETLDVAGVTTRVVAQRNFEGPEDTPLLVEISRAYFAQAPDGTVCFFGEDADEVDEAGEVVRRVEEWRARDNEAEAGIYMPGTPLLGQVYTMVYNPSVEVEDAEIVEFGETLDAPAGTFDDTVTVLEGGVSRKRYARGIGQIDDDGMEIASY